MIYIVDNGASYSDHAIHFVEVEDLDQESVVFLLTKVMDSDYDHPIILGVAEKIEWWEGGIIDLSLYIDEDDFVNRSTEQGDETCLLPIAFEVPGQTWKWLIGKWSKLNPDLWGQQKKYRGAFDGWAVMEMKKLAGIE